MRSVVHCIRTPPGVDAEGTTALVGLTTATRAITVAQPCDADSLVRLARRRRAAVLHAHDRSWFGVVRDAASRARLPWVASARSLDDAGAALRDAPGRPPAALVVPTIELARAIPGSRATWVAVVADPLHVRSCGDLAAAEHGREHAVLHHESGARAAELEELYDDIVRGRRSASRPPLGRYPAVSVVVPTHNRRALLERTLTALERQTYPHDKVSIVVVDDGSDDGTAEAVEARRSPLSISVVRHPRRTSAADARNDGVAEATGEVIAFTDSDCRPEPTWLEALVAGFADGIGIVQGRTLPDPDQPVAPLSRSQTVPREYGLYETCNIAYTRQAITDAGSPPFSSALAATLRRQLGPTVGGQAFGEDTDLAWRVRRAGHAARFAPEAVVHHHVFPPDVRYLLRRSALTAGFPLLVRRVPELRSAFLTGRVFLGPHRPFVWAALLGLGRRRWAIPLVVPYIVRIVDPRRAGWEDRLTAAPWIALSHLVESGALLVGSVRNRKVVL